MKKQKDLRSYRKCKAFSEVPKILKIFEDKSDSSEARVDGAFLVKLFARQKG